jgi:hypothetical protein
VLFGLLAIQFAHHPEGLVENGKRQWMRRLDRRAGPPVAPPARQPEPVDPATGAGAEGHDVTAAADEAAPVGAEESR